MSQSMDYFVLGPLEVRRRGRSVPLGGPMQRALLAVLLVNRNTVVSADRLVELLWEGQPPPTAHKALQMYVSHLRRSLEPDRPAGVPFRTLMTDGAGYLLKIDAGRVDAHRFEQLTKRGRHALGDGRLEEAATALRDGLSLWRGAPFDGLENDSLRADQARLSELRLAAVEDALEAELGLGRNAEIAAEAERLVVDHPLRERIWAHLMLARYRMGRQAEALDAYRELRRLLKTELGIDPTAELQQLQRAILLQDPSLALRSRAQLARLPLQPNALIGREESIQRACSLLAEPGIRLLTVSGAPGGGKTRLAVAVAERVAGRFASGAVFVDLAPIRDPALVVRAIVRTLGIAERPRPPLVEQLEQYLHRRDLLLVLDNFEQVTGAAPVLARILATCPGVKIVATSRERLGLSWEHEYALAPLDSPDLPLVEPDSALAYSSVELFAERARAVAPDFTVDAANCEAVASICRKLDGLPLAVELAAARVKVLHPEAILARLEHGLRFLATGDRDVTDRHRTLEHAIAWSYDLLSPTEQTLLRRLGVFAGGFTLDSLGAAQPAGDLDRLDAATSLVNKNLLLAEPGSMGEPRLRMLETIREFAVEQLIVGNELADAQRAHAMFYAQMAERAAGMITGPEPAVWLARLEREAGNFAAAQEWALRAEPELALRIAVALGGFWHRSGHFSDGRRWLRAALAATGSSGRRADGLFAAARLARPQGDYGEAKSLLGECLILRQEAGDLAGIAEVLCERSFAATNQGDLAEAHRLAMDGLLMARRAGAVDVEARALNRLGSALQREGDFDQARAHFHQALTIWERIDDRLAAANALTNLGNVANHQGDNETAVKHHRASVAVRREIADGLSLSLALHNLGNALTALGATVEAEAAYRESLSMARERGGQRSVGFALFGLGILARKRGDNQAARRILGEALRIRQGLGEKLELFRTLEQLSALELAERDLVRAVTLGGAAAAIRESIGATLRPADAALFERDLPAARRELGEASAESAWQCGARLSVQEAVDYALHTASACDASSEEHRTRSVSGRSPT